MDDFIKKDGYRVLYVLDNPHQAEKIVKKHNYIYGYIDNEIAWYFPNITDWEKYKLGDGLGWDIAVEDEKMLYDLEMDFRLSKIEMGL